MAEKKLHWRRYSLWQTIIALLALAVLAFLLVPDVQLILPTQKRAYEEDRKILKTAVESWRQEKAASSQENGDDRAWPTLDGSTGMPNGAKVNSYIDIALLASANYLKDSASILSADVSKNSTATNNPSGHYGWFIDQEGVVSSIPPFDGKYP